jgi:hypothetical protein
VATFLKKRRLSDKIFPENNPAMIPLHCGQVTACLACKLKEAKLLPKRKKYETVTRSARDCAENWF